MRVEQIKYIAAVLIICAGLAFVLLNRTPINDEAELLSRAEAPQVISVKRHAKPSSLSNKPELLEPHTISSSANNNEQLVTVQRPNWQLDETLSSAINRLKGAADSGDNEAAYIMALNMKSCLYAPLSDTEFDKRLQQASEYSDSGLSISRISKTYDFCAGTTNKQRNQFYNYLEAAAKSGYVPAQEAIANVRPEQFMAVNGHSDLRRDEFIEKRKYFVDQKIAFLESASKHGSIRALTSLSRMNYSQSAGPNGRIKAYANNQVILELTESNDVYNRYSWFQQKLQSQLTPEEIEQALSIANEWLTTIKANGTLYTE